MKKTLALILAAVMLFALVACGSKTEPEAAATDVFACKTVGDVLALGEPASYQSACYEDKYVYAFERDGMYYRVIAALPEGTFDKIMNLEYDETYDEKYNAIISPLVITKVEDLTELMLPQTELDALVGKTGEELLADGWYIHSGYNLDTAEFYMAKGVFEYVVTFDATFPPDSNTDDFNAEEAITPLAVKSVVFFGLGEATDVE